jgi:dTDP-4-amino-4,6-dideoxygalactose transaminase
MAERNGSVYESTPELECLVELFERAFASYVGVEHGVTVASGTRALATALRAVGADDGSAVFVPGFAPFSTVAAVLQVDAVPVFVDVHPTAYTISPLDLRQAVEATADPAAVVPVHLGGQPAELHALRECTATRDIAIVEDARDAPGATYQGECVGAIGDAGVFGFEPGRPLSVGATSGMVTTDDDDVAARAAILRQRDAPNGRPDREGRLDERAAARGIEGLSSLADRNEKRRALAAVYTERLRKLGRIVTPHHRRDASHAFASYIVDVPDATALQSTLEDRDIATSRVQPATDLPAVRAVTGETRELRITEELADRLLTLPLSPTMDEADVEAVCRVIEKHYDRTAVRN